MPHALTVDSELPRYRWTLERFLRAWEAGVFDGQRVELLDGEVVPMQIGPWHGETASLANELLPRKGKGVVKTMSTLPSGSSLPDPDVWVRKADAKPKARHGELLNSWHAEDVLLVVEVSDTTKATDLGFKAQLYGSCGYQEYWVVTREAIYVHQSPNASGYDVRTTYHPGQQIPVPYAPGETVAVSELLAADRHFT